MTRSRNSTSRARSGEDRASLYQEITSKIIAELEAGRLPWVQPWGSTVRAPLAMPTNAATQRRYSGINVLILYAGAEVDPADQEAQPRPGLLDRLERRIVEHRADQIAQRLVDHARECPLRGRSRLRARCARTEHRDQPVERVCAGARGGRVLDDRGG